MTDMSKINRTWLCSVVFLDIVNYSSQSVELQMKWKDRFNAYLGKAIKDVPEDERVILDTGDGAAACFLGAPEVAMFAALDLWHSLFLEERDQQPPFRVRIGINLGPVKLVRDINGAPNALGDGINAGQRIMSFAGENQILVSQSYFEVVSRLSDDYKNLFTLKGVEKDKHIREHTVYTLSPPGAQHVPVSVSAPEPAMPLPVASYPPPAPPPRVVQSVPENRPASTAGRGDRWIPLLVGGIVVVVLAAAAGWHFLRLSSTTPAVAPSPTVGPTVSSPAVPITAPAPTPSAPEPNPASAASPGKPTSPLHPAPVVTPASDPQPKPVVSSPPPVASVPVEAPAPPRAPTPRRPEAPLATTAPASQDVSQADRDTARDLRERYVMDAGRAATARKNAEQFRQSLAARGMSLNAQTAASLDRIGLFLDEAADALRNHQWDDALSSLQAVETETQKVSKAVGN
jgi:class 3 adenylate cyclase